MHNFWFKKTTYQRVASYIEKKPSLKLAFKKPNFLTTIWKHVEKTTDSRIWTHQL